MRPVAISSMIVKSSGWSVDVWLRQQVTRPGHDALPIVFSLAMNIRVELSQRLGIC